MSRRRTFRYLLVVLVVQIAYAVAQADERLPLLQVTSDPPEVVVTDGSGAPVLGAELTPRGRARTDARGALLLHRGRFVFDRAGALWSDAISSGLTIEVVAKPATERMSAAGTLVSWGPEDKASAIRIVQRQSALWAIVTGANGPTEIDLGTMASGHAFHCALEFNGVQWRGYLNGQLSGGKAGPPANMDSAALSLGGTLDGLSDWEGVIAFAAVHAYALGAEAIAAASDAAVKKFGGTPTSPTLIVDAELVGKSPVPTVEELAPYTQSLTVYAYKLKEVWSGKYDGAILYVAHWSVLDSTRLPFADVATGGTYSLALESFAEQIQLESENLSDSIIEDFSLPIYYDAGGTSLGIDAALENVTGGKRSQRRQK